MNETIKPKDGLRLRKVGRKYMLVEAVDGQVNLTNVFTLNETAARLWQYINEGGVTIKDLAARMYDEYDTDHGTVLADIRKQLGEWKTFGLIE